MNWVLSILLSGRYYVRCSVNKRLWHSPHHLMLYSWIYRVVIQSCDCTWVALLYSHCPNTVTGQMKPQVSQTLYCCGWAISAALHGHGHIKICATTGQTSQRHRALKMWKETHTWTNCELSPFSTESQAVTHHSKRTNLPTYQSTIEEPIWSGMYCEHHITTSQSRKLLYPSKPQSVWGIIGLCEYKTPISERKKEHKKKERMMNKRKIERENERKKRKAWVYLIFRVLLRLAVCK